MNLLNKLTIKNLKLNKKRTIVTIIGIMLSVALITAVASIYSSGIESLISYEKKLKGDFHVEYSNVSTNDISYFKNNREIEKISITKDIGYANINSKNENKPYVFVKAFTHTALNSLSVNLTDGRLPENSNEIVIPTHLKTNGYVDYKLGDTITLNIGTRVDEEENILNQSDSYTENESITNTNEVTYKIVGIIERPATNIESYSAPGYTFVTYINENDLSGDVDIYAKYTKKGVKEAYKLTANILGVDEELFEKLENTENSKVLSNEELETITKQLENSKFEIGTINTYLIGLQTNPINTSGISSLGKVAVIVIAIIVFTSIFCIRNSFDISITEKIKQYGMLRSVGATKKQIKKNVFYEATILGLIGIPLGILFGFLATFILVIVSNYFLKDLYASGIKLEFSFSYLASLIAIILGIITIYLSAFRSARKASKVSPIDSIRNSSNIKINSKKIKSPKLIKMIFGVGGEISYKNLKRNKKKYRTTVISIVVSVFVFIALSSFMSLAFRALDEELGMAEYDINVYVDSLNYRENTYEKLLNTTNLDNIENYSFIKYYTIQNTNTKLNEEYVKFLGWSEDEEKTAIENSKLPIISIGNYQYEKYIKSLGLNYDEIKDKGILIDTLKVEKAKENGKKREIISKYLRVYNYQEKDIIKGHYIENDEKRLEIEIGYITDKLPFGLEGNLYLIVSDEYFEKNIKNEDDINIFYKTNNAQKLQEDIDLLLKDEKYYLTNFSENVNKVKSLYTLIGIFLYGFIIVISLIGITNIFNTITTNMELRRQEFAMLKSVGMTKKEFNKMIRLESLFMGTKALIFGIIIGTILSYIIYTFLGNEMGVSYSLPMQAILITIFVVLILIFTIMKYSVSKINKQNTIETIRNENI